MCIALLAVAGALVYGAVFASAVQLDEVRVTDTETIAEEDVRHEVRAFLKERSFLTFTTSSILWMRPAIIRNVLQERFPRIATATVRRSFPDDVHISVTERVPRALFCNGTCVIVDKTGTAFQRVEREKDTKVEAVDVPTVTNNETPLVRVTSELDSGTMAVGERVVPQPAIQKILEIRRGFRETVGVPVAEIFVRNRKRVDVEVEEGWLAYFTLEDDIGRQLDNLQVVLERKIQRKRRFDLEYIDLRFGTRVYYKFTGEPRQE